MKRCTGCKPSELDGTEHIFKTNIQVPQIFSLRPIMPPVLDQGNTNKCVAYALTSFMDWKKNTKENDNNGGQFNIDELYMMRRNPHADGMEIKDALSILRHRGNRGHRIKEYAKVNSELLLKCALMLNGPCACALPVKSSHDKFWNGNEIIGYHCVLIVGYDDYGFEIRNSWGTSYADKGYIKISYDEFNKNILEIWTIIY